MDKWGVICKSCRQGIDLEEEYIPVGGKTVEWPSPRWKQTITCPNPVCRKTHEYSGTDLELHD